MRFLATLLLLALAIMATANAQMQMRPRLPGSVFPPRREPFGIPRPSRDRPLSPTFPRPPKMPFGPPRVARSISNDGGISMNVDMDRGKPSWHVGANKKIYENKHGSIHVNGGIGSHRGGRPRGQIGIGGSFKWG